MHKLSELILEATSTPQINLSGGGGISNHAKLKNLSFEESGHTGFQQELSDEQLKNISAVPGKEDKSNKTTILNTESTDEQYPSAGAVFREITGIAMTLDSRITELDEKKADITYVDERFGLASSALGDHDLRILNLEKQAGDIETALDKCGDFELVTSVTLAEKVAVIQHTFDKEYKELHIRFKIPMSDEAAADAASTNKARWMVYTADKDNYLTDRLHQSIYNMGNQFVGDYKYEWRAAFHIKMNGNYCRTDLWFGNVQMMDSAYAMTDSSGSYSGFVAPSVPISRDYIQKLKISFMYEAGKTDASIRYLPAGTTYEIWGIRK